MPRFAVAAALAAVLAAATASSALAQQSPALSYVQPIAPPGLRAVQASLHRAGIYNGADNGVWGPDSQSALQQFQQTHGLQVTGQMNPATAQALGLDPARLLQIASPPQSAPPPPPIRLSQDAIRNIQGRLRQMGYYHGGLDGDWGPETQAAVAQLQQNRRLQPTGQLNPGTVTAMGLNPQDPGEPVQ